MKKAFLGIDIGSISTKGVVIDETGAIMARSYLWTEGNPTDATRRVVEDLKQQMESEGYFDTYEVMAVGTTGSARRLVGAIVDAAVVKNEITAHAVGTTHLHPDVRTILEIGGQDSKIICIEGGVATDYAMNTLCAAGTGSFLSSQAHRLGVEVEDFGAIALTSKNLLTLRLVVRYLLSLIWCTSSRWATRARMLLQVFVRRLLPITSTMSARASVLWSPWYSKAACPKILVW